MMKIAVIIPAYNEANSLPSVIASVNELNNTNNHQYTPIVVNDASIDNTIAVLKNCNCIVLTLAVNLGIGGAVQTGFLFAAKNNFDFAVQIDGDGQHPANQIPNLLSAAINHHYDITIGSRFIAGEGFQSSLFRRIGINYFSFLLQILTTKNIKDTTSGMRLFSGKAMNIFAEKYPDEYPEPEVIILAKKNNLSIGEVAVSMSERAFGVSSIGFLDAIYYMAKVTLAIFFSYIKKI